MLDAIRTSAKGWIAWVIVIMISIPFVLWGVDQFFVGETVVERIHVGDQVITETEFQQELARQKQQLRNRMGDMYEQMVQEEALIDEVEKAEINKALWLNLADEQGLWIADQSLSQMITTAEVFQEDGVFNQSKYEQLLMQNGYSPSSFERIQKEALLVSQMQRLLLNMVQDNQTHLKQVVALQLQERELSTLRLDPTLLTDQVSVSNEETASYYEANQADYQLPEKVSVQALVLSEAELAEAQTFSEADIKNQYDQNLDQYKTPERRQASHILITVGKDAPQAEQETARATIAEIEAKLAAGEAFEDLAKAYSQDPGSAEQGGDLGFFSAGMMVPEFEDMVWQLNEGEVSTAVQTDFGLHIIRLEAIQASRQLPFEQVKDEVQRHMANQAAEQQYADLLERLNTEVFENSQTLDSASDLSGIALIDTEWFTRDGGLDDLTRDPKIIEAAFSAEVLVDGLNSGAIELSPTKTVWLRLKDHQLPTQQALNDVSDAIEQTLVRQKTLELAQAKADEWLPLVQAGELAPAELAKNHGFVTFEAVGWKSRVDQNVLPAITDTAFSLAKPSTTSPSWGLGHLPLGDPILVGVSGVRQAEVQENFTEIEEQLNESLIGLMQQAVRDAALAELTQRYDIQR